MWVSANSYLAEISARRVEESAQRGLKIAAIRRIYETARNYEERGNREYRAQRAKQERQERHEDIVRSFIDA